MSPRRRTVRRTDRALLATVVILVAGCTAVAPQSRPAPPAAPKTSTSQEVSAGSAPVDAPQNLAAQRGADTEPRPGSATEPSDARPCTDPAPDWDQVKVGAKPTTEGYASVDSVVAGTNVDLYVSTTARTYRIDAYRMGYYGAGPQACRVWRSGEFTGEIQHRAVIVGTVHEPTAPWHRSLTVPTTGWRPGDYLLRIDGGNPTARGFIPLTIRSTSFRGKVVLIMPDTTWQAYNTWGGYSLYFGPGHSAAMRARTVPFDRPYGYGQGAADFIDDDLPFVTLAEKIGVPLGYATDVDLERDPAAFQDARAIISVGHDEYYSPTMRQTLTRARDAGVNIGFFGANDIYRKIRFADSSIGPDRRVINYKDDTDPIGIPSLVTTQWRDPPSNDPESSLTGNAYQCASTTFYPIVVADASNWLFAGTGVVNGTKLDGIAGHEFDGIDPARPMPRPLEILFHSPARCGGRPTHQDTTYYTTPSNAGVLDIGAYFWTCAIADTCRIPIDPQTSRIITQMTTNFLVAAAAGPLGRTHPAKDTVRTFYPKPTMPRWR